MLMLSSDDLQFFVTLERAPSFAAAARAMSVSPPAVTQRLRGIEQRLGVRLFHRNPRGVSVTDEGALLAERAADILAGLDELADQLGERGNRVRGHLRVAAASGFGRRYVAPVVAAYRRTFPDVRISLHLSDNPLRLRPEAWDVIIHVGQLPMLDLQLITLAPNRRILCCAPAYLYQQRPPETPADLASHACLTLVENDDDFTLWRLRSQVDEATIRINSPLASNDGETIKMWAIDGLGILIRSEWDVADDLAAKRLVRILPGWAPLDAPVVALLASKSGRAARSRHFIEHMQAALSPIPWRTRRGEGDAAA